ncbi:hypothetical protein GCK72_022625 [Caenorhabditis remanei]|uniref:Piwi domain-containing protein n=1 Tax=Caenorhabditis remanei TaxID=31234 RepID=A0A6A5FUD6_CAERE|nr:hypothetical protein GCK72_022625 [Caenorhabditis remanei]KAF1746172.1 hypothetical protein GCK72_022625 [Caenorhabditis remanei]
MWSQQSQSVNARQSSGGSFKRGLISSEMGGPSAKKIAPVLEDSFKVTKTFNVTTNMLPLNVWSMKKVQRIKTETFIVSSQGEKVQLDLPGTVANDVLTNNVRLRQLALMTLIPYLRPKLFPKQRDFVFDSTTLYVPEGQYIGETVEEFKICKKQFENLPGFWKQSISRFLRNDDDGFLVRLTKDGYIPQGDKALEEEAHRSEFIRFLGILTSQKSNKEMYFHKGNVSYPVDSKQDQLDSTVYTRAGFAKSIFITRENAAVTMSINTQFCSFYRTLPILTLVFNMHKEFKNGVSTNSIDEADKCLRENSEFLRIVKKELIGLYVKATHLKEGANLLQIAGLSKKNAENEFITLEGHSITVAEYFYKVYNITLQHPRMLLIIGNLFGKESVFPMEVLKVAQYQLKHSMSIKDKKKYKEAIELFSAPESYMRDVASVISDPLELNNSSLMKAFGIECRFNAPVFSQAKLLSCPDIKIGTEVKRLQLGSSEIPQTESFEQPANIHQAAVISFDNILSKKKVRDLAVRIEEICLEKGIKTSSKFCAHEMSAEDYMLMDRMMGWKNRKIGIVIGIVENEKSDVYDALKYYRITKVQTIILTKETVDQILNDNTETINKVTRKINMKCGGINFLVNIPRTIDGKESALHKKLRACVQHIGIKTYQSIDMKNHRMTMIGASFNVSTSSRLSGHCYQEMHHRRKIQAIDSILLESLESYNKRSKQYPATIVLYRSICNNEDFGMVKEEVEAIRESFVGRNDAYSPSLVVLAVQEDALVRLFVPAADFKGPNTNVPPGTCIDTNIITYGYDEFILNSHTPTKGVSVPARYTILANDPSWTKNEIAHITWFMTFNNQVAYKPHAVVDVLHFAGKLAKRGTNILRFEQNITPSDSDAA